MNRCTLNLLPGDELKLSDARPVPAVAIPGQYQLPGWEAGNRG